MTIDGSVSRVTHTIVLSFKLPGAGFRIHTVGCPGELTLGARTFKIVSLLAGRCSMRARDVWLAGYNEAL